MCSRPSNISDVTELAQLNKSLNVYIFQLLISDCKCCSKSYETPFFNHASKLSIKLPLIFSLSVNFGKKLRLQKVSHRQGGPLKIVKSM